MFTRTLIRISGTALVLAFVAVAWTAPEVAEDRYPYRVPEWLWQDARRSAVVTSAMRKQWAADLAELTALQTMADSTLADRRGDEIAAKLGSAFTLRDLAADGVQVSNDDERLNLAVQIDTTFDARARSTLVAALPIYLRYALDDGVIARAIERSVDDPAPMPPVYEAKDGLPILDEFGNKVFTKDYKFYLKYRSRPKSAYAFKSQLRNALSTPTGESAVLVISRYTGNPWWGGAYYGFFNAPAPRLSRESPSAGFLYIRLNSDKFDPKESGWDSPSFWASKIAHEILHNMGYWHPSYKDPAERDSNNQGNNCAFIVAYERCLLEKATEK